jgi:maltooligosyltrehalose synthase
MPALTSDRVDAIARRIATAVVDPASEDAFTTLHRRFTGDGRSFAQHVYECKQRILEESLAAEVNMLARQLERIASAHRSFRDFTLIALTRALVETLTAFPVYRTYLRQHSPAVEDEARHLMHIAATRAAHQLWLLTSDKPSRLLPEALRDRGY